MLQPTLYCCVSYHFGPLTRHYARRLNGLWAKTVVSWPTAAQSGAGRAAGTTGLSSTPIRHSAPKGRGDRTFHMGDHWGKDLANGGGQSFAASTGTSPGSDLHIGRAAPRRRSASDFVDGSITLSDQERGDAHGPRSLPIRSLSGSQIVANLPMAASAQARRYGRQSQADETPAVPRRAG